VELLPGEIEALTALLAPDAQAACRRALRAGVSRPCVAAIFPEVTNSGSGQPDRGVRFTVGDLDGYSGRFTSDEANALARVPAGHFPLMIDLNEGNLIVSLPLPDHD
jgi:hypothetical protein